MNSLRVEKNATTPAIRFWSHICFLRLVVLVSKRAPSFVQRTVRSLKVNWILKIAEVPIKQKNWKDEKLKHYTLKLNMTVHILRIMFNNIDGWESVKAAKVLFPHFHDSFDDHHIAPNYSSASYNYVLQNTPSVTINRFAIGYTADSVVRVSMRAS